MKTYFRFSFVFALALACVVQGAWAQYTGPEEFPHESVITGKVFGTDGKPLEGVRVLAYHLSSELIYVSEPTNSKGEYGIGNLEFGYYDMAVETSDGLWPGQSMVNIPPASKSVIIVTLAPNPPRSSEPPRPFPGHETPSRGLLEIVEKPRGRDFLTSKRGVAILAGVGSVVLLILAGDSSETVATPF